MTVGELRDLIARRQELLGREDVSIEFVLKHQSGTLQFSAPGPVGRTEVRGKRTLITYPDARIILRWLDSHRILLFEDGEMRLGDAG